MNPRICFIAVFLIFPASARASRILPSTATCDGVACSASWPAGSIVYNADYQVSQVCHNGTWFALSPEDNSPYMCLFNGLSMAGKTEAPSTMSNWFGASAVDERLSSQGENYLFGVV